MSLPEKNRIYFDAEKNSRCIIKGILFMPGVKKHLFILSYGFGAFEKVDRVEVHESQTYDFCKRFQPIVEKSKEVKKQEIKKDILIFTEMETNKKKETFDSLRDRLFDAMDKVVSGNITVEQSKAVALNAQTIINSVNSELEFRKYVKDVSKIKMVE